MLSLSTTASADYGSNCVTYVRAATGMDISGNAGDWWDNAAGSYRRGHKPSAGAVLVFRPSGHMRAGHVAVVSQVVNAREILVNQANWPHGDVVEGAAVYDVSADNDWTTVRVAAESGGSWGRTNPTFGFIYRDGAPDREQPVVARAEEPQFPQPAPWATQPWPTQAQPRVEAAVAQAQPQTTLSQTTQPQPAQPQPRAAQPQPRFQLAVAETEEADDEDQPAPRRHHATPAQRTPEKTKADTPASRKELAKAKREHERELADEQVTKAKPDRREQLEAKADHGKANQQKLAKAGRDKAEHEKLAAAKPDRQQAHQEKLAKAEQAKQEKLAAAKVAHDKALEEKLAKADHEKAEHQKLASAKADREKSHQEKLAKAEQAKHEKLAAAKADREKAHQEKLAKAEQAKQEKLVAAKIAHDRPARHTHVARNDRQAPAEASNIEQIAQATRSGE
jgi:surface antigen